MYIPFHELQITVNLQIIVILLELTCFSLNSGHVISTSVMNVFVACEIWSPSRTGGFPPDALVSSHTKMTQTQTVVPIMSIINISRMHNLFRYCCKINKWSLNEFIQSNVYSEIKLINKTACTVTRHLYLMQQKVYILVQLCFGWNLIGKWS